MVDSKYSTDNHKYFQKYIGAIITIPELLRFLTDHFKTKKMCKSAVKKFLFVLRYVPDRYKTQKMCDGVILENGGRLVFVTGFYKN